MYVSSQLNNHSQALAPELLFVENQCLIITIQALNTV